MHVLEVLGRRVLVAMKRRPVGKPVHRRNQLQEVLRVGYDTIRLVGTKRSVGRLRNGQLVGTKRSVGRYEKVSWPVQKGQLVGRYNKRLVDTKRRVGRYDTRRWVGLSVRNGRGRHDTSQLVRRYETANNSVRDESVGDTKRSVGQHETMNWAVQSGLLAGSTWLVDRYEPTRRSVRNTCFGPLRNDWPVVTAQNGQSLQYVLFSEYQYYHNTWENIMLCNTD